MSDKSKLSYYFLKKPDNLVQESNSTPQRTTTNSEIVNINETIVLTEFLDASSPLSSSTSLILHDLSEIYENSSTTTANRPPTATIPTTTTSTPTAATPTSTTTTAAHEYDLLNNISINDSSKRDPGRGPTYAKDFLLLGPYQPNIKFPTINRRHFCYTWFQLYKWLEFSEMTKRAYCFVCRYAYSEGQSEKGFTVDGYNNWPVAIAKFNKHQATVSHKYANDLWVNAVKNHKNNNDVAKQLNRQHEKQTSENRLYLQEIIRTVLFLARQGLALRVLSNVTFHCCIFILFSSDCRLVSVLSNLLELLELRSLDNDLIKSKLKSLQYTHHSIQNELLYLIQENILSEIVFQIKSAKYFSIMMDESVDISRHEQVSLVIRYTDDQFHVYERFIGFQRASSTTGEALFKLLVTWLKQLDLDINNIVGQCFDGASAMRGIYKGVSTRLLQIVPTALYVHCNGHILNLCLVDLSQAVVPIRNNF
ncbi:unnamed protein product, partial [Rotaria sp. Silwood1]